MNKEKKSSVCWKIAQRREINREKSKSAACRNKRKLANEFSLQRNPRYSNFVGPMAHLMRRHGKRSFSNCWMCRGSFCPLLPRAPVDFALSLARVFVKIRCKPSPSCARARGLTLMDWLIAFCAEAIKLSWRINIVETAVCGRNAIM